MTHANFSQSKMTFIIALMLLVGMAVYATLSYKRDHYGESPFTEVLAWMLSDVVYGTWYQYEARSVAARLPASLGVSSDQSDGRASSTAYALPVLMYHGIAGSSEDQNFTRESFANQMFALKEAGWETITLREYQAFMRGEVQLPAHSFLLTFDDGAKSSFHPVDPILKALNFTAVSFILPKYSAAEGTHYYLSSYEIDRMLESGRWEIGSHGQDVHAYFPINAQGTRAPALANRIWLETEGRLETEGEYAERVFHDLQTARQDLEDRFSVTAVSTFAFPFGDFGHESVNYPEAEEVVTSIARQLYDIAFYQWWATEGFSFNYQRQEVPFMQKRIEPDVSWSGQELVVLLEGGLPKTLPYESPLMATEGWLRNWGNVMYTNDSLVLRTRPNETGATILLDGTGHWHDYVVEADLYSPNNTGSTIIVRFIDTKNYAFCNFGADFIHVEQVVDDERRVIKGYRAPNLLPKDEYRASARVDGRTVSCGIDGVYQVTSEFLDESLAVGGIGLKTWSPVANEALLTVQGLSARTLSGR